MPSKHVSGTDFNAGPIDKSLVTLDAAIPVLTEANAVD